MNQTIIVVATVILFIVITSISVLVYLQPRDFYSHNVVSTDCFFATGSLLNYLRNPQCTKPIGVGVFEDYQCAFLFSRAGYERLECEEPQKGWIEMGCMYINIEENKTKKWC